MSGNEEIKSFIRPYMSKVQLASATPWTVPAIEKMVARGVFKQGIHYFQPFGRREWVFKWEAIAADIERQPELLGLSDSTAQVPQTDAAQIEEELQRLLA